MPNSSSTSNSSTTAQVGQVVRGTGDLSPTKRTGAVDKALNGSTGRR